MNYDGTDYYFRKNIFGDIIEVFASDGTSVASFVYDAYGKVLTESGTMASKVPFRYRGYYYDQETRLYYLQSRYYDPATGRFISPDSIEYLAPAVIHGLNLYAYCFNNPIRYTDKTGATPSVDVSIDIWTAYKEKNVLWQSGRYKPRRAYQYSKNPFKYIGNNLLFAGETILSSFELSFLRWECKALDINSGITFISTEIDLLDGRMYLSDTDYLGVKAGSAKASLIDFRPLENNYTLADVKFTALTVGVYTEYVDAELLVGSFGATIKFKNGKFTFGFSWGIGVEVTIKLC